LFGCERTTDRRQQASLSCANVCAVDVAFDAPNPVAGLIIVAELATENRAVGVVISGADGKRRDSAGEGKIAIIAVGPAPTAVEAEVKPGPGGSHRNWRYVSGSGPHRQVRRERAVGKPDTQHRARKQSDTLHLHPSNPLYVQQALYEANARKSLPSRA